MEVNPNSGLEEILHFSFTVTFANLQKILFRCYLGTVLPLLRDIDPLENKIYQATMMLDLFIIEMCIKHVIHMFA